jgi:hypothetical protein
LKGFGVDEVLCWFLFPSYSLMAVTFEADFCEKDAECGGMQHLMSVNLGFGVFNRTWGDSLRRSHGFLRKSRGQLRSSSVGFEFDLFLLGRRLRPGSAHIRMYVRPAMGRVVRARTEHYWTARARTAPHGGVRVPTWRHVLDRTEGGFRFCVA